MSLKTNTIKKTKPRLGSQQEQRLEQNLLRDQSTDQLLSKMKANEDPVDRLYANQYLSKAHKRSDMKFGVQHQPGP